MTIQFYERNFTVPPEWVYMLNIRFYEIEIFWVPCQFIKSRLYCINKNYQNTSLIFVNNLKHFFQEHEMCFRFLPKKFHDDFLVSVPSSPFLLSAQGESEQS